MVMESAKRTRRGFLHKCTDVKALEATAWSPYVSGRVGFVLFFSPLVTIQTDLGTVSQLVRSYQVKASLSEPALSLSYLCLFFGHVSQVWWKGLAYFGDATGIAFTS